MRLEGGEEVSLKESSLTVVNVVHSKANDTYLTKILILQQCFANAVVLATPIALCAFDEHPEISPFEVRACDDLCDSRVRGESL
mgnify:CR=1 FL=1